MLAGLRCMYIKGARFFFLLAAVSFTEILREKSNRTASSAESWGFCPGPWPRGGRATRGGGGGGGRRTAWANFRHKEGWREAGNGGELCSWRRFF